jgi:hypothetical protein
MTRLVWLTGIIFSRVRELIFALTFFMMFAYPSYPGPDDVSDGPPLGSLQFTVLEVMNALLDLYTNKGPSPVGVPPLILKICASVFSLPLYLLFNRSLASCVFPDRWKLSFVTPIFKGRLTVVLRAGRLFC